MITGVREFCLLDKLQKLSTLHAYPKISFSILDSNFLTATEILGLF